MLPSSQHKTLQSKPQFLQVLHQNYQNTGDILRIGIRQTTLKTTKGSNVIDQINYKEKRAYYRSILKVSKLDYAFKQQIIKPYDNEQLLKSGYQIDPEEEIEASYNLEDKKICNFQVDGLKIGKPNPIYKFFWRFGRWLHLDWLMQVTDGLQNLPVEKGFFIIASNHQSHLDCSSVYIAAYLGGVRKMFALGARDYFFSNTLMKWFVSSFMNVVPISRKKYSQKDVDLLKRLKELGTPENPVAVLMFPEGTRSTSDNLQNFKTGIAYLASKLDIPVVPTYVKGTRECLPKLRVVPIRNQIVVRFGEPIYFVPSEDVQQKLSQQPNSQHQLDHDSNFKQLDAGNGYSNLQYNQNKNTVDLNTGHQQPIHDIHIQNSKPHININTGLAVEVKNHMKQNDIQLKKREQLVKFTEQIRQSIIDLGTSYKQMQETGSYFTSSDQYSIEQTNTQIQDQNQIGLNSSSQQDQNDIKQILQNQQLSQQQKETELEIIQTKRTRKVTRSQRVRQRVMKVYSRIKKTFPSQIGCFLLSVISYFLHFLGRIFRILTGQAQPTDFQMPQIRL